MFTRILSLTLNLFIVVLLNFPSACDQNRITSKIYTDLDNRYFCFVRLNATNQIGCSSSENGNSGLAKVIRAEHFQTDMDYLTKTGTDSPYVAIMYSQHFNLLNLLTLKNATSRIAGVIVLEMDRKPSGFSSDRSCPNEQFSLYVKNDLHKFCLQQQWNKPTENHVDGMLFHHWPFPIFLLRNKTEIENLLNKTHEHDHWPKLAIELVSPMSAAVDSVTCMRRSIIRSQSWHSLTPETYCDPLGGINIFGHTFDLSTKKNIEIKQNSLVVLATRMDTFSMFDGLAPGADSAISSLIAILSIAELLNRPGIREKIYNSNNEKTLLIAMFDGESFDYIGSGQTAYQMKKNSFLLPFTNNDNHEINLNLTHLSHFIELEQVAFHGTTEQPMDIFLHKHLDMDISQLSQIINTESRRKGNVENNLHVKEVPGPSPLPPSSVQSFLKLRNDNDFKAVVLTNHEKQYINRYYNSYFEDGSEVVENQNHRKQYLVKITALSTLVSRVIYRLVTNEQLDINYEADHDLIEKMLVCFLQTSSCELYNNLNSSPKVNHSNDDPIENEPPFPSYVSVYKASMRTKLLRYYTRAALNYFSGEKLNITLEECSKLSKEDPSHTYLWQNGFSMNGECVRSTVFTMDSTSPAFDTESVEIIDSMVKNHEYPLWTESKWKMSSLKMFVVSSQLQQIFTLISGIIVLLISIVIVAYLTHHSEYYFDSLMENSNSNRSLTNNVIDANSTGGGPAEDYPDWVRSSNEIEYAAITSAERSNSHQVFT